MVDVESPLPVDTRQEAFAANLLDLRLFGEGALERECCTSRVELAIVSKYFAALATHQQSLARLTLPIGHAGVELLVDAIYTKQVQLDGEAVVDLLQAASYLQVDCCLVAAGNFLREHAFQALPQALLKVARLLGLQALQARLIDCLAARFFRLRPSTLARVLRGMGTEAAAQLLQRDDLCCPLEVAVESVEQQGSQQPEGQPRAAAKRTIQLLAEVGSDGSLVAAKSAPVEIKGVAKAYVEARPPTDSKSTRLALLSVGEHFRVGLQDIFMAVAADGQHCMYLAPTIVACRGRSQPGFLKAPLKQPLCSRQGTKKELLLACYLPEQ
ncbi:hypothetical protein N2152v2_010291 [Parachlorella kessleri]